SPDMFFRFSFFLTPLPQTPTFSPYTTLFRSRQVGLADQYRAGCGPGGVGLQGAMAGGESLPHLEEPSGDPARVPLDTPAGAGPRGFVRSRVLLRASCRKPDQPGSS